MIRQLGVELNRFRARRAIVVLALLGVLVAVALAALTAYQTRPLTSADKREATAQAALESQRPQLRKEVRACERDAAAYLGPSATPADCAEALVPSAESYYPREGLDIGDALRHTGVPLALILVGLMVIVGCTFAGADWASGSLSTQLLFQPRRAPVWLAKAGAVVVGSLLITVVALAAFWAIVAGVAAARGVEASATETSRVAWHLVRTVALATAAALGGYALTMVFRHTGATLALLFVYAVGGEIAVNLLPVEGAGRWSVGNNVYGWLVTRHRYFDATIDCSPGERCSPMQLMTHLEAGLFLAALVVAAVLLSMVVFSRRDV